MKKARSGRPAMVPSRKNQAAAVSTNKEARINFIASYELEQRLSTFARSAQMTKSDVIREAVQEYIVKAEKHAVDAALEEGYKANYPAQARLNEQWEAADAE